MDVQYLSGGMKTNAARILDLLGIRYELREYEVDPNYLSAETVAAKIGMPLEQVWNTLVVPRRPQRGLSRGRARERAARPQGAWRDSPATAGPIRCR